ncbi:helix-turn-helix domain-containing protein [Virgibacillus proomii]|uniref:helix-turn-helix domain-containing protein n=1 Tax=Virgibacillus proomii TaxID=84407 RepID=UPI002646759D|nr:helix-turn-helix domain-containing protein [Virgibacillus proomii]
MSKRSHSSKLKYEVIKAYKNEDYTMNELCSTYKINKSTLYRWIEKFENEGIRGLEESKTWKPYSQELKETAVRDYLSGEYSLREVIRKHGISDTKVLRKWIKKYNSHRELKETGKGVRSMTKGRKKRIGKNGLE